MLTPREALNLGPNSQSKKMTTENTLQSSTKTFAEFVHEFVQRGLCEIVDMKL